ncbi:MAG TPA: YrdB family protein [Blastococcus sp.]|nr:YrdB family protein [Blastococcus sp.]
MGGIWNGTWLTVAFLSEVAALVALGVWGWSADGVTALRVVLAAGAPLVAAVAWGMFAAPQAPVQVLALTVLVKVAVFGSAAFALVATGHPRLAVALAAAALLSSVVPNPPVPAVA